MTQVLHESDDDEPNELLRGVKNRSRSAVRSVLRRSGWELHKVGSLRPKVDPAVEAMVARVKPHTMTGPMRLEALHRAVQYVIRAGVEGDFVECGVWYGGSAMMMALSAEHHDEVRDLWLYDTFEGMPAPEEIDVDLQRGRSAAELLDKSGAAGYVRAFASEDHVRKNLESTGYPLERVHFVRGLVEETIPGDAPDRVSLLRLDTDWYASTRHELEHLWPRLSPGGLLVVDDYGQWAGSQKAVDEFNARLDAPMFFSWIDASAVIAQKL